MSVVGRAGSRKRFAARRRRRPCSDVSLRRRRRAAITTLLGPSGSGKTTLLRIIAGLEVPDAGAVRIDGEDCHPRARCSERGVGFVFQSYALFRAHDGAREHRLRAAACGRRPTREIDARVDELLALVQLEELGEPLPGAALGRAAPARGLRARAGHPSPRCCCWTSPSARSTRACAWSCASGCTSCTSRRTSPPCSSPTTRRRRWSFRSTWW